MNYKLLMPMLLATSFAHAMDKMDAAAFAKSVPAPGQVSYTESSDIKFSTLPKEQADLLGLYPGYTEPNVLILKNGAPQPYKEALNMYVAKSRTTLNVPSAQIASKLPKVLDLANIQKLDPTVQHKVITPADLITKQVPGNVSAFSWCEPVFNKPKKELSMDHLKNHAWCEGKNVACFESCYVFPEAMRASIKGMVNLINMGKSAKDAVMGTVSDKREEDGGLATQSEVRVFNSEAEYGQPVGSLTGLGTPVVGIIAQNVFFVNQILQYTKLLVILQQHPADGSKTVMTVVFAGGFKQRSVDSYSPALYPVIRTGYKKAGGLLSGVPNYIGEIETKALAGILEN